VRTFFIQLRVYRKRDQAYQTFHVKALAETVTSLDQQIGAFSAGLQLVSAIVSLEAVFFDYPLGQVGADQYKEFGELIPDLYNFLLKRQRVPKGVTTEERNDNVTGN
jgi:hypothetical protein